MTEIDISQILKNNDYGLYKKVENIGVGAFGSVYLCEDKKTCRQFAMKTIKINNPNMDETICREVLMLAQVEPHDRLVRFYGSKRKKDSLKIFIEYMPQGSLENFLKTNGPLSESISSKITKQILEGIEHLHNGNIMHRDIKPANILLSEDQNVKLTDFGLSKYRTDLNELNMNTSCGTFKYMAPELLYGKMHNKSIDIWSLGVTLMEMFLGHSIYPKLEGLQFLSEMSKINFQFDYPENISKEARFFLNLVFIKNPDRRPSTVDMKLTKFILKYNS